MISMITGLPGNGKTLFALWYIKQKAEKENREVYYHNIKDLTLPWTVTDPEKWMDLPHGSIIVLDECQFVFPKKPNGAKLPDFYEQLATHRHKGFDIFLITQHPSLVDNFVRQLVGQHFHAVRKFGLNRNTIYEWSAVNMGPQTPSAQKSAVTLKWAFPKEVYGYYKSAEVHTVKRSIPGKLVLAVLFVVAVPMVGYYALDKYQSRGKDAVTPPVASSVAAPAGAINTNTNTNTNSQVAAVDPMVDAQQYMFKETPRVAGLVHTAPKYDQITVPVRAPVPAACIQIGTATSKHLRCQCYSQQGTKMDIEFNMCIQIAQNGWFKDFNEDGQQQQQAANTGAPARSSISLEDSRPVVLALNEAGAKSAAPAAPPEPAQAPAPRSRYAIGK